MKKPIVYILTEIAIIVFLPAFILFTTGLLNITAIKMDRPDTLSDYPQQPKLIKDFDISRIMSSKIKVYIADEDKTVDIDFEKYIKGVVAAEMPLYFDLEALKAQAIAARTYTICKLSAYYDGDNQTHKDGARICTDYRHCQAWRDPDSIVKAFGEGEKEKAEGYVAKLNQAVDETARVIITYEGNPINALYHSNSGGWTENSEDVWPGYVEPYLRSVPSFGEEDNSEFCKIQYFTTEEFVQKFKAHSEDFSGEPESVFQSIVVLDRTPSGRINTIKIADKTYPGTDVRTILDVLSTNLIFRQNDDGRIEVISFGYGHGVGMSQYGAASMAKKGQTCEQILKYYYTNILLSYYNI